MRSVVFAASLLAAAQSPAAAQEALKPLDRPDPASISIPSMSKAADPSDARDYDEHFYFHKSGVTYETAFADLDECRMYARMTNIVATPPKFVPLGSGDVQARTTPVLLNYGIVGYLVGAYFIAQAERDSDRATMNRCMAYKGYSRYGTSEAIWSQINAGSDGDKLARGALIASGPKPEAEAIDP
jgi:hypothetical protein